MKSAVLSNWNIPWLPSLALILFFSIFMIMLVMIFKKGTEERYGIASQMPLNDEGAQNE
jgi:cbb3-type cytochrome oxidase subunit 3